MPATTALPAQFLAAHTTVQRIEIVNELEQRAAAERGRAQRLRDTADRNDTPSAKASRTRAANTCDKRAAAYENAVAMHKAAIAAGH